MNIGSTPRIGVVICDCGNLIAGALDAAALCQHAANIPAVVYAAREGYPCSKDGRARLGRAIMDHNLERVLVAGCAPRLVNKLFEQTLRSVGIDSNYLDVRNIREQCVYVHPNDPKIALDKACDLIEMGVARLEQITSSHAYSGRISNAAMVIGSGLGGLTTAIALAGNGVPVTLVEESNALGGELFPLQEQAQEFMAQSVQAVSQNPGIHTLLNAQVSDVSGQPGNYEVSVTQGGRANSYQVGAIVVATSARPKSLDAAHWYDRSRVKTQVEYASELASAAGEGLAFEDVVMVLYEQETSEGHPSPLNCVTCIHQAIRTKELNPDAHVTILFRELFLGGLGERGEEDFERARELGVTFFRYQKGYPPVIGDRAVDLYDELTGESIQAPFDRVVLSMPLVPQDNADTLAALLRLPQDESGFIIEPRMRLRPGRYADDGIFVIGGAHQPVDTAETLFQAYLTGARVLRFLEQETIRIEAPVAEIEANLCTGCGNCVQVCPMSAIQLEKRDGILSLSEIDPLRCTGCGNCVVVCPVRAITMPGWNDAAILAQITAALQSRASAPEEVLSYAPRVVMLACEWSAFAAADIAGSRHCPYPHGVRIVRMNCSARFDPNHILWAFLNGADGVFLGTCYPGECHYGTGNLYAKERVEVLKKQLAQHGVDPRRLHLGFFYGDEGPKLAEALTHFVERLAAGSLGKEVEPLEFRRS